MTTFSSLKHQSPAPLVGISSSFNQLTDRLSRTFLTALLVGLFWLPGLFFNPALAMPLKAATVSEMMTPQVVNDSPEDDRTSALVACLPTVLSQPSLKRALSEMGNDQLERVLNLKAAPKQSEAEVALGNCLNRQAS
ncbi:MAG: hypothetical protein LH702_00850 [Phormidesmis sp. CAN_BIN44]|nr:hypothetical protein [Phormidesmis sp. CAN_BIN44]